MIEITIGGVTAVQMKNGQIKLARKGDRLEADPKNESYHVKNGHAVFVKTEVNEDNAEVNEDNAEVNEDNAKVNEDTAKVNSKTGAEQKTRKAGSEKKADGEEQA